MGQEIITGYTGTRHIAPKMDAAVWRGIFGEESCIIETGNNLEGSLIRATEFVIRDGVVSLQGYLGYGTHAVLPIDTCAVGYERIDLVCVRYTHDTGTLVDTMEYVVIKGEEVASPNVPVAPSYHDGIIADGANEVDYPLYKIELNGTVATVSRLAKTRTFNIKLIQGANITISEDGTISAEDTTYTGEAPILVTGARITHVDSGVTAGTKGTNDTAAETPAFGATFKVPGFAVNAKGHITSANTHNVKIPNTAATESAAGLMSAADKIKMNKLPSAAATESAAGWMSAADKTKLNKLKNDTMKRVMYDKTNVSIPASSAVQVNFGTIAAQDGYNMLNYEPMRIDTTNTTSPANETWVVCVNYWTADNKLYAIVRNLSTTAAKVSCHIGIIYFKKFS